MQFAKGNTFPRKLAVFSFRMTFLRIRIRRIFSFILWMSTSVQVQAHDLHCWDKHNTYAHVGSQSLSRICMPLAEPTQPISQRSCKTFSSLMRISLRPAHPSPAMQFEHALSSSLLLLPSPLPPSYQHLLQSQRTDNIMPSPRAFLPTHVAHCLRFSPSRPRPPHICPSWPTKPPHRRSPLRYNLPRTLRTSVFTPSSSTTPNSPSVTPTMVSPSPTKYAAERSAAVTSVALASALARQLQHSLAASDAVSKPDASPVTVADFAVQAVIVSHLHHRFPTDRFIAEESTPALRNDPALLKAVCHAADMDEQHLLNVIDLCDHQGGDGARTWILDPIDGTRGFIAMRQYCIALGLIEAGLPRVGVLGCPNLPLTGIDPKSDTAQLGCIFHAEQGVGTWMLSEADVDTTVATALTAPSGKRCTVSNVAEPSWTAFCESVETGHSSHELSAKVAKILNVTDPPLRMDSQAKYGCMARGDVSIFLRFPRGGYIENVWDSAPATIVVEEAGGRVTDGRGRPLDFSLGRKMDNDDGIVATNGHMHDAIIAAVQQAMREEATV